MPIQPRYDDETDDAGRAATRFGFIDQAAWSSGLGLGPLPNTMIPQPRRGAPVRLSRERIADLSAPSSVPSAPAAPVTTE